MSPVRAPRRDRRSPRPRRWAARILLLCGVATLTAGCKVDNAFTRQGMLQPITRQGHAVLTLWQGSWIAAWFVGALVWGGLIWAIIFFRKRSDQLPRQVRYNLPIEILYTVLPFITVGVLFYFTARDEDYVNKLPAHPAVTVNVVGFQWSWVFQYPQYRQLGPGAQAGRPQAVSVTGPMWNPDRPADSEHLPTVVIPAHEYVQFNLNSVDVVHAFWVPNLLFKRDLLPGNPNHFAIFATRTGRYIGHCSELCGLYHSRMLFIMRIVSPAQFRTWVRAQQLQPSSGSTH